MNNAAQLEKWMVDGLRLAYQGTFPEEKAKNVRAVLNHHLIYQRHAYRKGYKTILGLILAVITGYYFLPAYTFTANPIGLALIGKTGNPQAAWRVWQGKLKACGGDVIRAAKQLLGADQEALCSLNRAVIAGKHGDPFSLGFCIKM